MALSGSQFTSDSGRGSSTLYGNTVFSWSRTGWGYSGSIAYHDIYWEWRTNGGASNYWQYFFNGSGNVNGGGFSIASPTQAFGNGATLLSSGSFRLFTDTVGNASFPVSLQGGIYTAVINTTGSWTLYLDNIPLTISQTANSGNITDESNPNISFSNPASHNVTAYLELPLLGGGAIATRTGYTSGAAWSMTTAERNTIRALMANTNSTTINYVLFDTVTSGYSVLSATITIVNAAPVFSIVDYHDSNSTTATITGNNKFIVQNNSVINVDIADTDKAVAQKSATMVSYTATINSTSTNFAYSASTINQALNTGSAGASTNQTLSVTAVDSRGNTTTVQKTVTMVAYIAPTLNVVATREDGFGEDTTIDATGTISTLTVSGTDKNTVNATSGMGYKVWAVVGGSEPASYTNIASTITGTTVNPTSDPIETLDQSKEYNLKVKITDILQTITYSLVIGIGQAAFRIGDDGLLYNNGVQVMPMIDEDSFATNTDTKVPTQQSVKAYVDNREVVLFSGTVARSITISEAYTNFRSLRIICLWVDSYCTVTLDTATATHQFTVVRQGLISGAYKIQIGAAAITLSSTTVSGSTYPLSFNLS